MSREILTPYLKQLLVKMLNEKSLIMYKICNKFPPDVIRKAERMGFVRIVEHDDVYNLPKIIDLTPDGFQKALELLIDENYPISPRLSTEEVAEIIRFLISSDGNKLTQPQLDKLTAVAVMNNLSI